MSKRIEKQEQGPKLKDRTERKKYNFLSLSCKKTYRKTCVYCIANLISLANDSQNKVLLLLTVGGFKGMEMLGRK